AIFRRKMSGFEVFQDCGSMKCGAICVSLGSKGLLPPTDAYELLRCKAAPAILVYYISTESGK
ncbi:MAG: hypothetical protein EGR15_03040, partial [Lachnospiraceae bacterium]|nr:hypothetical protein [Lachnospiraceae bacterium]